MTPIPPIKDRPAPNRPTTRPAAMPVVAPSVANVATISPARSRPSARSLRIIGTEMMALPIWAAAATPLPMSSSTCRLPAHAPSSEAPRSIGTVFVASLLWLMEPSLEFETSGGKLGEEIELDSAHGPEGEGALHDVLG